MFQTIKSKFIINLVLSLFSLVVVVVLAYSIAVSKIHLIMEKDIVSVATALEKTLIYIGKTDPKAYENKNFKEELHTIKVGKTGYVYLIDSKGLLLVHPKDEGKNLKDTDYGSYIISHKEGGMYEYVSATTGQEKISAFRYIPQMDAWIVPGVNKADYFEELKSGFMIYFSLLLFIISAVLIILNYITGNSILIAVEKIIGVAKDLSTGDGDLRKRLPVSNDTNELSIMSSNVNDFISKIDKTILEVKQSSSYQTSLATALTCLTSALRTKTDENDSMAKKTMNHLNSIRSSLDETVEGSKQIVDISQTSEKALEETSVSLDIISSKISLTSESTNELNDEFTHLISDIESLKGITAVIRDIADLTNLLALNAAIEAARAGIHGRSFAVVAEEVRNLSNRTNKAINEVDSILSILVQSMSSATDKIEVNSSIVKELVKEGESVKENFKHIDKAIKQNVDISKEGLNSIVKMNSDIVSIIEQIQYMSALSFENGGFINEVDDIALQVKNTDIEIDNFLNFFKLSKTPVLRDYKPKKNSKEKEAGGDIFF